MAADLKRGLRLGTRMEKKKIKRPSTSGQTCIRGQVHTSPEDDYETTSGFKLDRGARYIKKWGGRGSVPNAEWGEGTAQGNIQGSSFTQGRGEGDTTRIGPRKGERRRRKGQRNKKLRCTVTLISTRGKKKRKKQENARIRSSAL